MEDIVLVGFGGHAKSVADTIERIGLYNIVGYTDVCQHESKYEYLGTDDCLDELYKSGIRNAFVCLGYMGKGNVREILYKRLKSIGYIVPVIVDPSAIVSKNARIEEGSFVGKGAIVNAEAVIGKMCIINTKSLIEHECVVGDFSHVAVGAVLCGQVKVERNVFVGANATIVQGMNVPEKAFIKAGSIYMA